MPTILITAGEPSGDRLAAALMATLRRKRKDIKFIGVGGPLMAENGLKSLFPMSDLAVMGLAEVLPAIPRILRRVSQLSRLAEAEFPALVITVDSQDFSARVAHGMQHLRIPHIHYVAPKVWAWRQGRTAKLRHLYTHLLTILPFEAPFFAAAGIPTTYVGHPATTAMAEIRPEHRTFTLAMLPGSRRVELRRHWPTMLATYRLLRTKNPELSGLLALPDDSALPLLHKIAPWSAEDNIQTVAHEHRFKALASCRAALAKSGTVNLELALLNIPAVVMYKMNPITFALAKKLVKTPYISLPNLILNPTALTSPQAENRTHTLYPEFIQNEATPENLARALTPLLSDTKPYQHQKTLLTHLHAAMKTALPPAELAANIILPLLPR